MDQRTSIQNVGFFGVINGAEIKNITFRDAVVKNESTSWNADTGGVIGDIDDGTNTVLNLNYYGDVFTSQGDVGGVIGQSQASNQVISYCTYSGTVSNTGSRVTGGIIGRFANGSEIKYCSVLDGSIEGRFEQLG